MRRLLVTAAILCGCCWVGAASAAEMRSIDVQYDDGRYMMVSVVWFNAGIDEMYHVFSRWDLSEQFSSAVVEARDLEADEQGRPGFFIVNKGCVWFFCKTLTRRGYVEHEPRKILRAYADPAHSDFRMSNESWRFAEHEGGTIVTYELLMEPDFWVPPAIGPYLIKRKLKKDGGRALNRIEVIAQELAGDIGSLVD